MTTQPVTQDLSMVERVARAMWAARPDRSPAMKYGVDLNSWEAALPREREAGMAMARAAIEAMKPDIIRLLRTATVNMPPNLAAEIVERDLYALTNKS